jgi:hypothetical protein
MRLRPRQGLLLGIAVLASGSVVLEIALGRAAAPLLGPHLALAASTLALAGAGLGGALLGALPGLARRPALLARLSSLSGFAAAATLVAVLVLLHVKVPDALDRAAVGPLALIYLSAALPFVLVGLGVAAVVRHVPVLAARVVFSLFTGAALGAPLSLGAVRAGALRAGLVVIALYAAASFVFYLGARSADRAVLRPRGWLVATFLLAAAVLFAGDVGAPWLKLPSLRFTALDKAETQEWSGLGLVSVDRAQGGVNWIRTDGMAGVPLYDGKTAVPVGPDEMAYVIHQSRGPVAILGGGAGREVRMALKYGQRDIDAVDLDPILLRALILDRYKKNSADVYDNPAVNVALEDGRVFVRRSGKTYQNIVLALPDTLAALAAGALAPAPVELYTVESFADLLDHVAPEGTLTAMRWDVEQDRLLGLAAAALRRGGAADPSQHLYACSAGKTTALLIKKTPLSGAEIGLIRTYCRRNKMLETFAPDAPVTDPHRRFATDAAAVLEPSADLRPPTDDRPFFASTVPAHLVRKTLADKGASTGAQGLLTLVGLGVVALVLVFFSVGMPLAAWPRWSVGRGRSLLFFTGVGASLSFAAWALVPRLVVLAGHPLYAYTTVLPALFASVAVGGLVMGRVRAEGAEAPAGMRAEVLVVVLALAAVALGPLVQVGLGWPFALRTLALLVPLVPVGLLCGSLLALGVRIIGSVSPPLVPWCWGMGAVGGFVAGVIAVPAAMMIGYSAVLLAAGVSALVAAACVPRVYSYAE